MVVRDTDPTELLDESADASSDQEQAFLLTRRTDAPPPNDGRARTPSGQAVLIGQHAATPSSSAVMRAAVRVLSDDEDLLKGFEPPLDTGPGSEPATVVLAWNGPLTGPVVRRAARLSHRVMVVVSSGMNALELSRMHTRLGRDGGIGYVLVNLDPRFVEYEDRVGDVEEFWEGSPPGLRQRQDSTAG